MMLERYAYERNRMTGQFEFLSEGPNGKIRKVINYSHIKTIVPIVYFNLSFGDWDEAKGLVRDDSRSNNRDTDKILATVASTALDFCELHPYCRVIAVGSTGSRTRLYQMAINKYIEEISEYFEVYGLTENGWEPFNKGINYQAFG